MKLVLGCDNYIYRCDGAFYAKASDKAFYDRYLRVFDALRIVARTRTASVEEVARYVRLDDARTEVWPVYFFRGPKQYLPKALRVRHDMRGAADGCGACIVRLPSITGSNLLAEVRRKGIPYAVEIVDDAHDEMTGTRNPLYKAIWLLIHHDLLRACRHAAGIARASPKATSSSGTAIPIRPVSRATTLRSLSIRPFTPRRGSAGTERSSRSAMWHTP